jgi:hypothetical protein
VLAGVFSPVRQVLGERRRAELDDPVTLQAAGQEPTVGLERAEPHGREYCAREGLA